jgi:carboxymethylenebutenolidase
MERKKASDFPQEVIDIFQLYVHCEIDRRSFVERASKVVGAATAVTMLEQLQPNFAWAQQVPPSDRRIKAEYTAYPSPQGNTTTKGYLVRPANASGKLPGVVVIHENRGLNPYIEDVARRFATSGYMAFAPDALAPLGGYPAGDEAKAGQMFGQLDGAKRTEDLVAAATYLKNRADCTGKIGAVGFCFGGGIVNTIAFRLGADLAAGAPYYGAQPPAAEVPKIKAAMLIHYAGEDARINAGWPAYETALKAAGVRYESFTYPGTQHGFHNDTTPRYDEAAAKLSFQRTLDHFAKYVKAS